MTLRRIVELLPPDPLDPPPGSELAELEQFVTALDDPPEPR